MKLLTIFALVFSLSAFSQSIDYPSQEKKTKPLMKDDKGTRHLPSEEAQQQEAGPKGEEARKAALKDQFDLSPEEQEQKIKGK